MIIYNNSSLAFREDVDSNRIADIVEGKFVEKLGHKESPSEKKAWRNSLHYMETVIRNANVADDCGVLIEYVIPNTSNRVDFMITGQDQQGNENYVLIELKQ